MMYPEPLMPAPTDLGGLAIHQGGRSQELPQQPSGSLDLSPPGLADPAPEHQEQDMENFISIFLQVSSPRRCSPPRWIVGLTSGRL